MTVKTGADIWASSCFHELAGRRIGFVANQSALLSGGRPTLAALGDATDVSIGALFSPEHGAFGTFDSDVPDQVEPTTGLAIRSLYGEHKKPQVEWLSGLDCLVFEMQDIGARFYTYASTLGLCLEACAQAGIELIVLDRPNPITGTHFEGPCAERERLSFTAYHTIPIRHGLTLGELAKLYAAEKCVGARVIVAPCGGWRRSMWFDQTGLAWTNPSPAMRNLRAATLYPGLCLLEQSNVSLGRGTEAPFERIGAPYIDARRFTDAINGAHLAGVTAEQDEFTPEFREFAGETCHGSRLTVTDRDAFNSVAMGLHLIYILMNQCANYQVARVAHHIASDIHFAAIERGDSPDQVAAKWESELDAWRARIGGHLLYE